MTDDDLITLTVPRHEVAALVLYHLNQADRCEWEVVNGYADSTDAARERFPHFQRVDVLGEHVTDDLRAWVIEQRDKEGRRLLIETVETFVQEASNKEIRAIYDLILALKRKAGNKAANPLLDEEED